MSSPLAAQNSIVIDLLDNQRQKPCEPIKAFLPSPNQYVEVTLESKHLSLLEKYSGLNLSSLASMGIQTIPSEAGNISKDEVGKDEAVYQFNKNGSYINTGNCMGILQFHDAETKNSVRLQIKSRFDNGEGQPFLLYLLSKVFGGVFSDIEIPSNDGTQWDVILAMIFCQKLLEACTVGMFRQYRLYRHNDMRYRGTFDISRHLNSNIPFIGKIAYNTHNISYDNTLNHLIRYALNKISKKWPYILSFENNEMNALYNQIMQNTPSWNPNGMYSCIMNNRNPLRHPLYAQYYESVRLLAIALLRDEGANPYDAQENEVQGFLFDGAWLWEEYLNTILMDCGYARAENKTKKNNINLFEQDNKYYRYPDFYKADFVLDAKYKELHQDNIIDRDDMNQIITYMHVLNSKAGGFICPCNKHQSNIINDVGTLKGYGGDVKLIVFPVPVPEEGNNKYAEYAEKMKKSEAKMKTEISEMEKALKNGWAILMRGNMGLVRTQITLKNAADVEKALVGLIDAKDVREVTLIAMVDTGAGTLVIDEETCRKLGITIKGQIHSTLADGSKAFYKITASVEVHWNNRWTECPAVVVPGADEILLGAIPLEGMDLSVNPNGGKLTGNHGDEVVYSLKSFTLR